MSRLALPYLKRGGGVRSDIWRASSPPTPRAYMLTCNTAFLSLSFAKRRNGMTMRVWTGGTVALGVMILVRRSAECDAFPR